MKPQRLSPTTICRFSEVPNPQVLSRCLEFRGLEPPKLRSLIQETARAQKPESPRIPCATLRQDWWTAKVYDRFVGRTLHEINSMAGFSSGLWMGFMTHGAMRVRGSQGRKFKCPQRTFRHVPIRLVVSPVILSEEY